MKKCSYCNKELPESQFSFNNKEKTLLKNQCKTCRNLIEREKYHNKSCNDTPYTKKHIQLSLINALLAMSRYDINRLFKITKESFFAQHELSEEYCNRHSINFYDLLNNAEKKLNNDFGLIYPTDICLPQGQYLIVGDSHGKHTKQKIFDLLHNINSKLKIKNIIHIGHLLDDDNDINYNWKTIKNLIILSKKEEIRIITENNNTNHFKIIRDCLSLGDLKIRNQDFFANEYTSTSIASINSNIDSQSTIFNFHKHELESKTSSQNKHILHVSPGCLCEPFVTKTRIVRDWINGGRTAETYTDSYSTYRRRDEMKDMWEQGMIIVNVNEDKTFTLIPLRIYDIECDECGIGYFDKIITNKGMYSADYNNLLTGDIHSPYHDLRAIDVVNQVCKIFNNNFDKHIILGDLCHNISLNHHEIERGNISKYAHHSILSEYAITNYLLKYMKEWANDTVLLYSNHERFVKDFTDKNPQFKELLNISLLLGLDELNIDLIKHQDTYKLHNAQYMHGDIKGIGTTGSIKDKLSKIYNSKEIPLVLGHIHYPSIRQGCYSVGLLGKMDQNYNEVNASNWIHGFGISTTFKEKTWITTIPVIDYKFNYEDKQIIGFKTIPELVSFTPSLTYNFSCK